MSETEFAKLADKESMLPDELELPEDDTGACYSLCCVMLLMILSSNDATSDWNQHVISAPICNIYTICHALFVFVGSLGCRIFMSRAASPARPYNSCWSWRQWRCQEVFEGFVVATDGWPGCSSIYLYPQGTYLPFQVECQNAGTGWVGCKFGVSSCLLGTVFWSDNVLT